MRNEDLTDILEKSLSTEPGYRLAEDFAGRVTLTVIRRDHWKANLREYFQLTAAMLVLAAIVSGVYYVLDKELLIRTIHFLVSNLIPVVFLILVMNFVFFADRVLLRLLFSRRKTY